MANGAINLPQELKIANILAATDGDGNFSSTISRDYAIVLNAWVEDSSLNFVVEVFLSDNVWSFKVKYKDTNGPVRNLSNIKVYFAYI